MTAHVTALGVCLKEYYDCASLLVSQLLSDRTASCSPSARYPVEEEAVTMRCSSGDGGRHAGSAGFACKGGNCRILSGLNFHSVVCLVGFRFSPPPPIVCVLVVVDVDVDADVVVVVADVVRTAPLSGSSACHMFVFV